MKKFKKKDNSNMVRTIVSGVLIAIIISLVGCGLAAVLFLNNAAFNDRSNFVVAVLQFVSVLLGALVSGLRHGRKYVLSSAAVGVGYYLILVAVTVLVFDSSFAKITVGLLACALAVITASLLCLIRKTKRKHKIR